MERKIAQLTEILDEISSKKTLLADQHRKVQEDLRQEKRHVEDFKKRRAQITEKIDDLVLHNQSAVRHSVQWISLEVATSTESQEIRERRGNR